MTPDRISIEYETAANSEEDHTAYVSSDTGDAWDEEEDEELMDKLERERQKMEQLYDPSVGWAQWDTSAGVGAAAGDKGASGSGGSGSGSAGPSERR